MGLWIVEKLGLILGWRKWFEKKLNKKCHEAREYEILWRLVGWQKFLGYEIRKAKSMGFHVSKFHAMRGIEQGELQKKKRGGRLETTVT